MFLLTALPSLGFLTSLLDFCWPLGIVSPLLAGMDGRRGTFGQVASLSRILMDLLSLVLPLRRWNHIAAFESPVDAGLRHAGVRRLFSGDLEACRAVKASQLFGSQSASDPDPHSADQGRVENRAAAPG